MIAAAAVLAGAAKLLTRAVASVARERVRVTLRHGLSALARPGAGTLPAVTALGLGVLVVVAIALLGITKRLWLTTASGPTNTFPAPRWPSSFTSRPSSGIFSFLINYVTSEPPSLPSSWMKEGSKWFEVRTAFAGSDFKDGSALAGKLTAQSDPVSAFLAANLWARIETPQWSVSRGGARFDPRSCRRVADTETLLGSVSRGALAAARAGFSAAS